jgi:hypothetical protein
MDASGCVLTVITPSVGRPGLARLIESIERQDIGPSIFHVVLWDDHRMAGGTGPEASSPRRIHLELPAGFGRNGEAPGSPLRAVGLVAAPTPWVTFADDDVTWDADHARRMLEVAEGRNWVSTLRRVRSPSGESLGVDRFESVGDDPGRRVPYEMCDGNCMMFRRELGVVAAQLYRETRGYDDDRLMYAFLKAEAGARSTTGVDTIEQVCPERLVQFFRANCSPRSPR